MEPQTLAVIDSVIVIGAIVGATQLLKKSFPESIQGPVTILVAILLGLLAGFGHLLGLTPISGIFYGLAAVAAHTLVPKKD